jgi:arginase family enzyme
LADGLHLDLDGTWSGNTVVGQVLDLTNWGPKLRFSAPSGLIEQFFREVEPHLPRFLLYGSGDFHHLTGLWARRIVEPFVLISFDNHPDWDVRPPKWSCGAWVNRALELPQVERVSVWGCGNFECWWPAQIFGNRRAEREGRLEVHPWADDRPGKDQNRRGTILRINWQERFQEFLRAITRRPVYVTIDLDCLVATEAVTNWENGRFTAADLDWAIRRLREHCPVVGGDLCGGFSEPHYARWKQRFAAEFDHPKLAKRSAAQIREINFKTLAQIWPLLVSE